MVPKDYYLVLGVSRRANLNKIKKAYRTVAKQYHPDMTRSPESTERFREIKEAYETLGDEQKRRRYDDDLAREESAVRITRVPDIVQRGTSVFDRANGLFSHVDEFFEGFVPGFFDRSLGRGKDLYFEAILSPSEAAEGGLFPITVPVVEDCPRCSKAGFWEAFFCPVCYGYGRVRGEREFSVSIPPNVKHGMEFRLSMEDIGLKDAWVNIVVYVDATLEEGTN
jgi:molecular chaperone DnaJ